MNAKLYGYGILTIASIVLLGNSSPSSSSRYTQSPPQAMVLVESDSLLPFYISVIEEPNIYWQTYINWQKSVFSDYPDMYKNSMPADSISGLWLSYNDPLIDKYFEHPAFQWYPVTGVSWLQVLSYLDWKTDRLNEAMLIENKICDFSTNRQYNSENFNTEAYLSGQYDLLNQNGRKLPQDKAIRKGKRRINAGDGVFFPHYRLPTEAEWEAGRKYSSDPLNEKDIINAVRKESFLEQWTEYYNIDTDIKGHKSTSAFVLGYNFFGGVNEWLIEHENYLGGFRLSEFDMLRKNGWLGFEQISPYDSYGELKEKDSIGKLGFNYVQISNVNTPIYLSPPQLYHYKWNTIRIPNPFYKNKQYCDSAIKAQFIVWLLDVKNPVSYLHFSTRNTFSRDSLNTLQLIQNTVEFKSKDSLFYSYTRELFIDNSGLKRKYVSSSYRNKKYNIGSALQTYADPELGFRCVLPFSGVALKRK